MSIRPWSIVRETFAGLALALAVLAALAVPPSAWAEPPEFPPGADCVWACQAQGGTPAECQQGCNEYGWLHCWFASPTTSPPCDGWCVLAKVCNSYYSPTRGWLCDCT